MPLAEIESVVSVSSEDPLHPAKNLLTSAVGNNVKKWLCQKTGERNATVIFKLKEKANITNIVVGNENTAIIEILVLNNDSQESESQVLLPATEIQTLHEVRAGKNKNGVHFFTTKDFKSDVAGRSWEKIKVVCNQPYDSHIRYGLSCFVVKSIKDENDCNIEEVTGNVKNTEVPKHVELPEKDKKKLDAWKENMLQRLQPSATSSLGIKTEPDSSPKRLKLEDNGLLEAGSSKKTKPVKKETVESSSQNGTSEARNSDKIKKLIKEEKPPPPKRDFNKMMTDVRFSMSGYENPLRSELRNKALEMGARYFGDWNHSCTHLICAFLNTPKFSQVKSSGHGKIVVKDWIEECYGKRRRLPWRRFALDVRERQLPISEEDEEEEEDKRNKRSNKKDSDRRRRLPSSSSSDTEDEIERVRARNVRKKPRTPLVIKKQPNVNDLYNADTEEDNELNESELLDDTDRDETYQPDKSSASSLASEGTASSVPSSSDLSSDSDSPRKKKTKERKKANKNKISNTRGNKQRIPNSGKRPDTSDIPLPPLPDTPSHNYFIAQDEKGDYRNELERYIHAFNGKKECNRPIPPVLYIFGKHSFYVNSDIALSKMERIKQYIDSFQWSVYDELSNKVEFAITDDADVAKEIVAKYPNVMPVKSDWIWKCNDEDSLVSPEDYLF